MFKKIKEKCNHEWYGRRYCHKCGEIEMWGKISGNTALDLENKLIVGENPQPKEKETKEKVGKCEKCGIEVNSNNWGRIDFVNDILFCRKCLKGLILAEKLDNSLLKFAKLKCQKK